MRDGGFDQPTCRFGGINALTWLFTESPAKQIANIRMRRCCAAVLVTALHWIFSWQCCFKNSANDTKSSAGVIVVIAPVLYAKRLVPLSQANPRHGASEKSTGTKIVRVSRCSAVVRDVDKAFVFGSSDRLRDVARIAARCLRKTKSQGPPDRCGRVLSLIEFAPGRLPLVN